jgi:hypothetical protein
MLWKIAAAAAIAVSAIPSHASEDRAAAILHAMRENASLAQHNAEIRQWMRLNYETDRIVADFHRLQRLAAGDEKLRAAAARLEAGTKALDAARTRRDGKAAAEAARQLLSAVE